jgi:hypothetical protein
MASVGRKTWPRTISFGIQFDAKIDRARMPRFGRELSHSEYISVHRLFRLAPRSIRFRIEFASGTARGPA